jgi:hypothetical protein
MTKFLFAAAALSICGLLCVPAHAEDDIAYASGRFGFLAAASNVCPGLPLETAIRIQAGKTLNPSPGVPGRGAIIVTGMQDGVRTFWTLDAADCCSRAQQLFEEMK